MAQIPWVEKFRPKVLNDVVGNRAAVERLRIIASQGNIPNLILTGPPGIGKTTSLLCLCNELLGNLVKEAVIELNASDERGIEVVRQSIKSFAKKHVNLPPGRHKIILLDEADSMTPAAQQAMRRIMEKYSNTTRFVFACNMSDKVIEPIQSRCAIVRFTKVEEGEIATRLAQICEQQNVGFTKEGIDALAVLSDGDMRTAVNGLQATAIRYGFINPENVQNTVDAPNPTAMTEIYDSMRKEDLRSALTVLSGLEMRGHSASDIVQSLFKAARRDLIFGEKLKLLILKEIGLTQMAMAQGVSSPLQLDGLLARIYKIIQANK
ncbi:P-loop containing nucleoside triphosphate hydrolase protein [Histomonas meleagridis]|uniref:P-loop containing nucleoside triphosphate hydrolase protein n=1 Tax=Histomonas meleagridis TaxID=135588 RepID=UPI00355962E0|nr:P-loop containing nucleoside triphosphate hydrolase protein [Histomonas meleagridis]KAH0797146.1 P-loop containing nucleoside triphosphate hydrolase protein [Histomonas meleagridis]